MSPVSHPVVSLVEVWAAPSLLRHVTIVPLATVSVAGLNELGPITTVLGGAVDGGGLVAPYGFAESFLHPGTPKITKTISVPASITMFLFMVVLLLILMFCIKLSGTAAYLAKVDFVNENSRSFRPALRLRHSLLHIT